MAMIQEETPDVSPCAHFWMIESPSGPYSRGECKNCGEEREFRNSLPLNRWDGEKEKAKVASIPAVSS